MWARHLFFFPFSPPDLIIVLSWSCFTLLDKYQPVQDSAAPRDLHLSIYTGG